MECIKVVIDDENSYFSAGLQGCIMKYAEVNNKILHFLVPEDLIQPDIVFVSYRRWGGVNYAGTPLVVTVKEKIARAANGVAYVLYRTDDQRRLFELLSEVLSDGDPVLIERRALTRRERQVVNYLRNGFDQSQTARLLGVSVKTVHSHKRSVMSKLMLHRHHDFIYWLLSQDGEYS